MIIKCNKCNKSFELDDHLIPKEGRLLKCGNCENTWFFKNENKENLNNKKQSKLNDIEVSKQKSEDNSISDSEIIDVPVNTNKSDLKFKISKASSYFVVILISIIALIIVLDTFKTPIGYIFPAIEKILYNLYETIKDIYLFLKDLII